jgi:hypothetical protein
MFELGIRRIDWSKVAELHLPRQIPSHLFEPHLEERIVTTVGLAELSHSGCRIISPASHLTFPTSRFLSNHIGLFTVWIAVAVHDSLPAALPTFSSPRYTVTAVIPRRDESCDGPESML